MTLIQLLLVTIYFHQVYVDDKTPINHLTYLAALGASAIMAILNMIEGRP